MRITRLELQNIGVFDRQVIEFQPKTNPESAEIHILTGVNGTGKSTILYALASVFDFIAVEKRFRFRDERSVIRVNFDDNTKAECYIMVAVRVSRKKKSITYTIPFL